MAEPISLPEAKLQLRVTDNREDNLITGNIVSAREWVEKETGQILTRREVTERISAFATSITLLAWPIAADQPVTLSYYDRDGAEQTITGAAIRSTMRPARLKPAVGLRWPAATTVDGAIAVTFTAGYAEVADVPQSLKQAMQIMITAFYEARDGEAFERAEKAARSLCRGFKRKVL